MAVVEFPSSFREAVALTYTKIQLYIMPECPGHLVTVPLIISVPGLVCPDHPRNILGHTWLFRNTDFHHANLLRRLLSTFNQKVNRGNESDQVDDPQACIFKSKGLEIKLFVERHAENNGNNCPDWIHLKKTVRLSFWRK
jgi:hypothetical protein